ncbi:MAG: hypothetical protein OSA41_05650 [Erythrobacter sp.]|nr:hypothetical protein [Erythrobacter sp.]
MAETSNQSEHASLYGIGLDNDLPMGATVSDPAEWSKILDHYRRGSRDMRDQAGEYQQADPYFAEWHQLEGAQDEAQNSSGACLWAVGVNVIAIGALIGWLVS